MPGESIDRKLILQMLALAISTMFVAKVLFAVIGIEIPWSTASTVGGVIAFIFMGERLKKSDVPLPSSQSVEASSGDQTRDRVRLWVSITRWLMYGHCLAYAYQMNAAQDFSFVWLWVLMLLSFFYTIGLIEGLCKK